MIWRAPPEEPRSRSWRRLLFPRFPRGAVVPWIVLAQLIAAPGMADTGNVIGHVLFSSGTPRIIDSDMASRPAPRGEPIRLGELVSTSVGETAQVKLKQGSLIHVRPTSEVSFESGGDLDPNVKARVIRIRRGSVRLINREIAHWQSLAVKTSSASLLLTDADCEVIVVTAPSHNGGTPAPGTYAFTNAGTGTMRTAAGSIDIAPGQIAFATTATDPPSLIMQMPSEVEAIVIGGARGSP